VLEEAKSRFRGEIFSKFTLASSTGLVKSNFSPPVYDAIVPPQWLPLKPGILENYFCEAMRLGETLLGILTGGEVKGVNDTYSLLRLICYPPATSADSLDRGGYLEIHTDKSWITLLAASSFTGLQFLDCDGVSFVEVLDTPNALLVNIGDALQTFSGGHFLSRPHRAVNRDLQVRVSLPLFVEPKAEWPEPAAPTCLFSVPLS
jgi:hypothetical protein